MAATLYTFLLKNPITLFSGNPATGITTASIHINHLPVTKRTRNKTIPITATATPIICKPDDELDYILTGSRVDRATKKYSCKPSMIWWGKPDGHNTQVPAFLGSEQNLHTRCLNVCPNETVLPAFLGLEQNPHTRCLQICPNETFPAYFGLERNPHTSYLTLSPKETHRSDFEFSDHPNYVLKNLEDNGTKFTVYCMIQPQTRLNVADNTGARELMCITVLGGTHFLDKKEKKKNKKNSRRIGGSNHRGYGRIGDVIVAVVKEAIPVKQSLHTTKKIKAAPVQKSEIVKAVIVRTRKELKRENGMSVQFDDNAAVIIDQEGNPKGTRVFGPVAKELRKLNFTKLVSIAPEVL